jgi:deoxycytidine triphosphate deaminase
VQEVSVDLRLGYRFWCLNGVTLEKGCFARTSPALTSNVTITPASKEHADTYLYPQVCTDEISLGPGAFILGETYERVILGPALHAFIEGRSSMARHGIIIHCTAPHIEPQWNKRIRLEIANLSTVNVRLVPGKTSMCQLLVDRIGPVPTTRSRTSRRSRRRR